MTARGNSVEVLLASTVVISCSSPRLSTQHFALHLQRLLSLHGLHLRVGRAYTATYGLVPVHFRVEAAYSETAGHPDGEFGYLVHALTKIEVSSCGYKTKPRVVGLDCELAPLFTLLRKSLRRSPALHKQSLDDLALSHRGTASSGDLIGASVVDRMQRLKLTQHTAQPPHTKQDFYTVAEDLGENPGVGEQQQVLAGRCVLVLGQEGCGKTQLLRQLQHSFSSVMYGRTTRNLSRLFEIATHRKPCLVLIDDLHQLPGARHLAPLLLSSPAEVVVVCTSRDEVSVPSEVRQACTARLTLPRPLAPARRSILFAMMHDAELSCSPDILASLAESTIGCTGQDLNDIVLDLRAECATSGTVGREDTLAALHKLKQTKQMDATHESSSIVGQPKMLTREAIKVCGYADLFTRLDNYVQLTLHHSSLYEKLGMSPPSRILLFGPPGCGKTWLVKALAERHSLTIRTVTRADVFSKYFGESEKKLDDIFNKALASCPCILHFPGFDGLASARAQDHHQVEGRVVNLLKARLDGAIRLKGLILVAESSRPELLDSAIIRRGRFLSYEYVGLPDQTSRAELIRHRSPQLSASAADMLTSLTQGFTVSEVQYACQELPMTGEAELEEIVGSIAPSTTQTALKKYRKFQDLYQS